MNQILISPVITEKATKEIDRAVYVFKVAKKANKLQIADALKKMYKVKVESVNIINVKPEKKIVRGRFYSNIRGWKKAIVTLEKGQKIALFDTK